MTQDTKQSAIEAAAALVLYDKHGREIKRGDIVKVFHFVGARNKRHYMYKQCLGIVEVSVRKWPRLKFSHLNLAGEGDRNGFYDETPDGRILEGYEIVQSAFDDFENRPRRTLLTRAQGET